MPKNFAIKMHINVYNNMRDLPVTGRVVQTTKSNNKSVLFVKMISG